MRCSDAPEAFVRYSNFNLSGLLRVLMSISMNDLNQTSENSHLEPSAPPSPPEPSDVVVGNGTGSKFIPMMLGSLSLGGGMQSLCLMRRARDAGRAVLTLTLLLLADHEMFDNWMTSW